ncbi:hypothetical protein PACTADRAFT_84055 [Pachysolen tannophilus NRRL Y-2460]|uniref:Uncharacterized protein n=1 Tax=Pachysolen tannophilus NRRL Y-2460 TaxID=669874 RepID=A0A1E4TYD4_PACTA|nr:hypothetical protein PACTADRAFT_84055 [Pachysolen tannophilus NRRL Y-2460]
MPSLQNPIIAYQALFALEWGLIRISLLFHMSIYMSHLYMSHLYVPFMYEPLLRLRC